MPSMPATTDHRAAARNEFESAERPNLARRYGTIGIPAVAAAARYHTAGRNPAYAPVPQPVLRNTAKD
jgi:hypothetical protein